MMRLRKTGTSLVSTLNPVPLLLLSVMVRLLLRLRLHLLRLLLHLRLHLRRQPYLRHQLLLPLRDLSRHSTVNVEVRVYSIKIGC